MQQGDTITLRGENGAEWVEDVPAPGPRRNVLEGLIATGKVVVLDAPELEDAGDDAEPLEDGDEWGDDVPTGTVDDVVAWVRQAPEDVIASDGWPERAQAALEAEQAKGDKARTTLVATLRDALER